MSFHCLNLAIAGINYRRNSNVPSVPSKPISFHAEAVNKVGSLSNTGATAAKYCKMSAETSRSSSSTITYLERLVVVVVVVIMLSDGDNTSTRK